MVKRRQFRHREVYNASNSVFSPLMKAVTFSFIALLLLVVFLRASSSLDRFTEPDHVLVFETEEEGVFSDEVQPTKPIPDVAALEKTPAPPFSDYEKIKEDEEFDVIIDESGMDNDNLVIVFHHDSKIIQPIRIIGDVEYELSKETALGDESVTLTVFNWNNEYFRIAVGAGTEVIEFGNQQKKEFKTALKDAKGNELTTDIEITDSETGEVVYSKKDKSHSADVGEGRYNVKVIPENHKIKSVEFKDLDIEDDVSNLFRMEDPENGDFEYVYSIDPTGMDFTEATVTVDNAKGNRLYKCKDWNFELQTCEGDWKPLKSIKYGEPYTITLTPDDPGFAEINATDAEHLNENYVLISNIFAEIEHKDDIWSEPIPEIHFVRVTYASKLKNGNVIDVYARSSDGAYFEVYEKAETSPILGISDVFTPTGSWTYITVENLSGTSTEFDFKIINGTIEFDYIHDSMTDDAAVEVNTTTLYVDQEILVTGHFYSAGLTASETVWMTDDSQVITNSETDRDFYCAGGAGSVNVVLCECNSGAGCAVQADCSVILTTCSNKDDVDITWTLTAKANAEPPESYHEFLAGGTAGVYDAPSPEVTILAVAAAPVISAEAAINLTNQSAIINWTTDIDSNTSVNIGESLSLGNISSTDDSVTAHTQTITALTNNTLYYYNVTSCATSLCSENGTYNFTTNQTIDTTPPAVSTIVPISVNEDLWTNYNATVTDNANISSCDLYIDNVLNGTMDISATDSGTNYTNKSVIMATPGTFTFLANCSDTTGNYNDTSDTTVTINDITPPVISDLTNHTITNESASINWTTDEVSNTSVSYGETTDLENKSSISESVTAHNMTIIGLINQTLYYYNITSCDAAGNCKENGTYNFTSGLAGDGVVPYINWTNATIDPVLPSQLVNISANVTDDTAVDKVWFEFNGTNISMTSMATDIYYNDTINISLFYAGMYNYTIYANDTAGNNADSLIGNFTITAVTSVRLDNSPINFTEGEISEETLDAAEKFGFPLNVINTGNVNLSLNISGTNMSGELDQQKIPVIRIEWDRDGTFLELNKLNYSHVVVNQSLSPRRNQSVYFRINISMALRSQNYTGNITFTLLS